MLPPTDTTSLVAMLPERRFSRPPLETTVPLAVPPEDNVWLPPLDTVTYRSPGRRKAP